MATDVASIVRVALMLLLMLLLLLLMLLMLPWLSVVVVLYVITCVWTPCESISWNRLRAHSPAPEIYRNTKSYTNIYWYWLAG